MNPILADMFRHNLWANLALLDLCATSPDDVLETVVPGTYGSVRDTLRHMVGAEERYVAALLAGDERRNPTLEATEPDVATLRDHARRSGEELIAFAQSVDGDPALDVTWHGESHRAPASLFLVQAINHATEHRAQVMTALTQAGVTPPELDGWSWDEQRQGT